MPGSNLNEPRVLRDPVHGYIHITSPVIWRLLDTPEFQRLRRIRQLGGVFQVYHTAEHSRFSHSLGVYEIVRRMTEEVPDIGGSLSRQEKLVVLCAALLHDVGHGPYSHSFERLSHCSHEQMTVRLILEDTDIHTGLAEADPFLPAQVAAVIQGTCPNPLLCDLISSQLDADRMDYLLRDAYETGTSYGTFDLERILRCLRVKNGRLCIKESGMHSVEDYIMARYHMYWQVYLHPVARAYEVMLQLFFDRYSEVRSQLKIDLLENVFRLSELTCFLELDDYRLVTGLQQASVSDDRILADLADRLLNRRLFDWIEEPDPSQEFQIRQRLEQAGLPTLFYLREDVSGSKVYLPYHEDRAQIRVLCADGEVRNLSHQSAIVSALDTMKPSVSRRLYFPKEAGLCLQNEAAGGKND
ncbi:HD domain-containing protein [Faecalibaculum rodentium]|uniref:Phosphohydrolase n=1 Tax=Faecalibaculum rodentium TaxID=1702221 RepID=A0A1Q9YN76_9FIRM|nr:HD domain-containing protein [Faecalibaculum rodentium]OLU47151.1 phosphohydrolase [Faecalibaculum rodentium]